jgi:hypothetical protein
MYETVTPSIDYRSDDVAVETVEDCERGALGTGLKPRCE